jgi:hypothetical protein
LEEQDFSPLWELGTIPLKIAAAFSPEAQPCPSSLLGQSTDYVKFEIPKFQRGLVWKKQKKKDFLVSLINGWPTGVIVLTKINSKDLANGTREITWHVIDGQQRLSTFLQFQRSFWSEPWYVITDEMKKAFEDLAETLSVEKSEDVSVALTLLTQGDAGHEFSMEILDESSMFLARICRILQVDVPTPVESPRYKKAINACRIIRLSLQNQRDSLDKIPVAIITISPKQGITTREARNISSRIFSKLNSGIPLSKYDLLAASWVSEVVPWRFFTDQSESRTEQTLTISGAQKKFMLDQMQNRIEISYKSFLEDVDEEEASIEELGEEEVSLFDFLYGLSKSTSQYAVREIRNGQFTLADRKSFPQGASSGTQAFDTCALLFSGSLSQSGVESLTDNFPTYQGEYDISLVAEHYLEAAKEIDTKLSHFTHHETKKKKRAVLGAIQSSVYLASYLNTVYDIKLGEDDRLTISRRTSARQRTVNNSTSLTNPQRKNQFRENIPSWWLLHTISDVFQGSDAYKQAVDHVWTRFSKNEENQRISEVIENDFMLYQPELSDLSTALKNLFVKEFRVSKAPESKVPSQSALALFFAVYKNKAAEMQNFDMDHVIAYRSERNSSASRLQKPIPLNHVANFMPLNPTLNRGRGNTAWAQYYLTISGTNKLDVDKDILINPVLLVDGLLSDVDLFGNIMIVRYCNMINLALQNTNVKIYIEKSQPLKKEYLIHLGKDIATTLNIRLDETLLAQNISLL